MSEVTELTEFLLTGQWESQLNPTNPIGSKGEIVVEYVKLLYELWKDNDQKTVKPREFRNLISKYNNCVYF